MQNKIPDSLLAKSLMGECSEGELRTLENWKTEDKGNMEEFNKMRKIMEEASTEEYTPDVEKALGKVSDRISEKSRRTNNFTFFAMRIASAILLTAGIVGLVYVFSSPKEMLLATTEGDMPKEIILPDGSQVTLNENSEIRYASRLKGQERRIYFKGEAYFKIAKNEEKPFVIESGNAITKVLGTEFNLSAKKADTLVKIMVTEGLVSFNFQQNNSMKEVLVKAGHEGEINTKKGIITSKVIENKNFMAWKNGILTFDNQEFGSIIQILSDFYEKEISIADSELEKEPISTTFDSLEFEEVLSQLELIMDVEIEHVDDGVIIH